MNALETNKKIKLHQRNRRYKKELHRWFFEDSGTILCDTILVDTCHYTFVQTYRMYDIKSEP